jgi:hypothetical protein
VDIIKLAYDLVSVLGFTITGVESVGSVMKELVFLASSQNKGFFIAGLVPIECITSLVHSK